MPGIGLVSFFAIFGIFWDRRHNVFQLELMPVGLPDDAGFQAQLTGDGVPVENRQRRRRAVTIETKFAQVRCPVGGRPFAGLLKRSGLPGREADQNRAGRPDERPAWLWER